MGEGRKEKVIREFSAGGVVFKRVAKEFQWLLIKPSGTDRWQLPKGKVDKGETSKEAAVREVAEEGGVNVRPVAKIGTSQYFFVFKGQKIFKTVIYFLMEYAGDKKEGHDHEVDETVFVDFAEALEKLTFKDDKKMLKKGREILERGIQGNLL